MTTKTDIRMIKMRFRPRAKISWDDYAREKYGAEILGWNIKELVMQQRPEISGTTPADFWGKMVELPEQIGEFRWIWKESGEFRIE